MADRSQFWQNVDATKPDKLSHLSVRQLRDYQNYFLEVQGDYNPALPPHENTVASERLTLLQDEIGSRRGKRQPGASVAERRHKQVIFWMKVGAAVAIVADFADEAEHAGAAAVPEVAEELLAGLAAVGDVRLGARREPR